MARALLVLVLLLVPFGPERAWAQQAERSEPRPLLTAEDGYYSATALLGTLFLLPLDGYIADRVGHPSGRHTPTLDRFAAGVGHIGGPGTLVIAGGLYLSGAAAGDDRLATSGIRAAEAVVLAEIITYGMKGILGRARPRVEGSSPFDFRPGRGLRTGDYRALPSGHTSAAFAAATALALRPTDGMEPIAASLLFTAASLTGASRVVLGEHWFSDVVLGAAVGVYSGWKVTRYHDDRPGAAPDRWLLSISIRGGRPAIALLPDPVDAAAYRSVPPRAGAYPDVSYPSGHVPLNLLLSEIRRPSGRR